VNSPDGEISYLSAEHHAVRLQVRASLDAVVAPLAEQWEAERRIPESGWRALGAEGLLGFPRGGAGFMTSAVFLEELGRTGYAGLRAAVGVAGYMAPAYVERFGSPEQRDAVLPAVSRGEVVMGLAISEETGGSDLRELQTHAMTAGPESYRICGEKHYVAIGSRADLLVTLARTRESQGRRGLAEASLFLVDTRSPGVTVRPLRMLGWHAADICRVELDGVLVPAGGMIGRPHRALVYLVQCLDFERLVIGLATVGGVAHCLELLQTRLREHQVRGIALGAHQAVRHRMVELIASFEMVRQYAYHAAWLHSTGKLSTRVATILKLEATELAARAAQACLQYHGAQGFLSDSVAERLYRDAAAGTIAGGATELLRDMVYESW
jgi:acyl-CoA dehydrogenase